MDKEIIFNNVSTFLKEELNIENKIHLDSIIRDDLEIDSLAIMDLIFFAETLIDQEIQIEDIENIETINDLVEYLYKKVGVGI